MHSYANLEGVVKGKQISCSYAFLLAPSQLLSAAQVKVFLGGLPCLALLSLVTDLVCVDSLCFHLPPGQTARPNKTFFYSLFLEPYFVRQHFIWLLGKALSIFQHPFRHSKLRRARQINTIYWSLCGFDITDGGQLSFQLLLLHLRLEHFFVSPSAS